MIRKFQPIGLARAGHASVAGTAVAVKEHLRKKADQKRKTCTAWQLQS